MAIESIAITSVEDILGYKFTDTNCLWEALNAPGSGVSAAGNRRFSDGNKRLALKGDAAIRNVIVEDWFPTNLPRAIADTTLKNQVSNVNLSRICKSNSIEKYINLNPSSRGAISDRTTYDTMEAILGAVAEDGGHEALRAVMRKLGLVWHQQE